MTDNGRQRAADHGRHRQAIWRRAEHGVLCPEREAPGLAGGSGACQKGRGGARISGPCAGARTEESLGASDLGLLPDGARLARDREPPLPHRHCGGCQRIRLFDAHVDREPGPGRDPVHHRDRPRRRSRPDGGPDGGRAGGSASRRRPPVQRHRPHRDERRGELRRLRLRRRRRTGGRSPVRARPPPDGAAQSRADALDAGLRPDGSIEDRLRARDGRACRSRETTSSLGPRGGTTSRSSDTWSGIPIAPPRSRCRSPIRRSWRRCTISGDASRRTSASSRSSRRRSWTS